MNFTQDNIFQGCIYFSVRHCIQEDWLNDRDQFVYPNEGWKTDTEFQNDCLTFRLLHGQNSISSTEGVNYWIPFTEDQVAAKGSFQSRFMTQFIQGRIKPKNEGQKEIHFEDKPKLNFYLQVRLCFHVRQKPFLRQGLPLAALSPAG